jgi:hypothetical protein
MKVKIPPRAIKNWVSKNFTYKERKNGEELLICSPFDDDRHYKFNINTELALCNDWRGNERWAGAPSSITGKRNCSFIKFVQLYRKVTYSQALKEILGAGYIYDYIKDKKVEQKYSIELPNNSKLISDNDDVFTKRVNKWLKSRGLTADKIKENSLHYSGFDVIWPYYEYDELVYWQSRSCLGKIFTFPTGTNKGEYIYGFDNVEPASYLIIVEAIFDAHTLGDQTVAIGGATVTDGQYKKIKAIGPKDGIILAADLDYAGIMSILVNKSVLSNYELYYSLPPEIEIDGKLLKDWNELYTDAKMSLNDIRKEFNDGIKKLTSKEYLSLAKYAKILKKIRS